MDNTGKRKIYAKNLIKIYGKRTVVNDLSMDMTQGEVVGILGPNGAGKTTTFYMILGLAKPNRGKVLLDDKDITRLPMYRRARMGLGIPGPGPLDLFQAERARQYHGHPADPQDHEKGTAAASGRGSGRA